MTTETLSYIVRIVLNVDDHLHSFGEDFSAEGSQKARDALYAEARELGVMPRESDREKSSVAA